MKDGDLLDVPQAVLVGGGSDTVQQLMDFLAEVHRLAGPKTDTCPHAVGGEAGRTSPVTSAGLGAATSGTEGLLLSREAPVTSLCRLQAALGVLPSG